MGREKEKKRGGGGGGGGGGALRSLIAQNNTVILCFKVHDLSASRKTNEIYGGLNDHLSLHGRY